MNTPNISATRAVSNVGAAVLLTLFMSGTLLAQELERGISVSILGSGFVAGESGPHVVSAPIHPETGYSDTFGTGVGLTVQYFSQVKTTFRWQAGLVYRSWPGQHFAGGEFQPGWEFGATGRFDDLTLAGISCGLSIIRQPGPKLRPFASMDLAIVRMSQLNVAVNGASQPYWESAAKDFLTMQAGLSYKVSPRAAVLFYAGMSILGQPESAGILSSGTGGSAFDAGIGVSYAF